MQASTLQRKAIGGMPFIRSEGVRASILGLGKRSPPPPKGLCVRGVYWTRWHSMGSAAWPFRALDSG